MSNLVLSVVVDESLNMHPSAFLCRPLEDLSFRLVWFRLVSTGPGSLEMHGIPFPPAHERGFIHSEEQRWKQSMIYDLVHSFSPFIHMIYDLVQSNA
jgi:hypothetical protein